MPDRRLVERGADHADLRAGQPQALEDAVRSEAGGARAREQVRGTRTDPGNRVNRVARPHRARAPAHQLEELGGIAPRAAGCGRPFDVERFPAAEREGVGRNQDGAGVPDDRPERVEKHPGTLDAQRIAASRLDHIEAGMDHHDIAVAYTQRPEGRDEAVRREAMRRRGHGSRRHAGAPGVAPGVRARATIAQPIVASVASSSSSAPRRAAAGR